jgi:hypothetical protein
MPIPNGESGSISLDLGNETGATVATSTLLIVMQRAD